MGSRISFWPAAAFLTFFAGSDAAPIVQWLVLF